MHQKIFNFLLSTAKSQNHLKLYQIIKTIGPIEIPISRLKFQDYLIKTIVGQQISTKAAASIWKKVEVGIKQHQTSKNKDLQSILRSCGLSERKAQYALGVLDNPQLTSITKKKLKLMQPEIYTARLLALKGIGPWTVEMSRIFYLGDEDIFSEGDYGIKAAHTRLFSTEQFSKEFYCKYAPYRTYLSLYLWRSLDFQI